MNGDSSPSSSSSSDEENESNRRRGRGRRGSRQKSTAKAQPIAPSQGARPTSSATNNNGVEKSACECLRDDKGCSNDSVSKRHTIHVENPNEQQRQSLRGLNLGDDFQPQERSRAMSQGPQGRRVDNHNSVSSVRFVYFKGKET